MATSSRGVTIATITAGGTVLAWGYNEWGQLGLGHARDVTAPVPVPGLMGITAVAGGDYHSIALRSDGTVVAFGRNNTSQMGNEAYEGAGEDFSLALTQAGTLVAWGKNWNGQLGNGVYPYAAVPSSTLFTFGTGCGESPVCAAGVCSDIACTGRGVCTAQNACSCPSNFGGATCGDCAVGYSNYPTCNDVTPPTLVVPPNLQVVATGVGGATVSFVATATDSADGTIAPTCAPESGSTFPIGVTTVNCHAMDSSANVAHGSFTVTVVAQPPADAGVADAGTPPTPDGGTSPQPSTPAEGCSCSTVSPASLVLVLGISLARRRQHAGWLS